MPEGDSVYQLAARLRPVLETSTLAGGELRAGSAAGRDLGGLRIDEIDTHGKHLLMRFDDQTTLHTHLRMQGSWTITAPGKTLPRRLLHEVRVRLLTSSGRTAWGLELPVVELMPTREESAVIGHLGPDPLRADWDPAEAERRLLAAPDRAVIAALLDQRCLAGLGNMWVNEVCFLRGLWPWHPIGTTDVAALVRIAARGLVASVTVPGMFQTTTGVTGRGERHWVMGRAGRPCLRCGTTVLVRDEVTGDPEQRRTWWCPRCQPEPGSAG